MLTFSLKRLIVSGIVLVVDVVVGHPVKESDSIAFLAPSGSVNAKFSFPSMLTLPPMRFGHVLFQAVFAGLMISLVIGRNVWQSVKRWGIRFMLFIRPFGCCIALPKCSAHRAFAAIARCVSKLS